MENKLNVVVMGQNCEKFIGMCLDSVKDADAIIYCDGGSIDGTLFEVKRRIHEDNIIKNKWDPVDKGMNGKQRNFYLKYLKENYPNDWCLVLDADEIVEDLLKIKEFIQPFGDGVFDVHMRHMVGALGWEDNTKERHYVPRRLFKISDAKPYPEHSHPVLETDKPIAICDATTIWHLGHLPIEYLDYILKRYKEHMYNSIIHPKRFLHNWKNAHLLGQYPVKEIIPTEIPKQLLERFELEKDEFYFANRKNLEVRHFIMSNQWVNYFKSKKVLDLGCGVGIYGYAMSIYGVEYQGLELSKWAVENTPYKNLKIKVGDIRDPHEFKDFDLVLCVDVLEHLEEEDLDQVLANVKTYGKNFLFSIPFLGDPNLELDSTHKIKKEKQWWINKLTNHFKVKEVPDYFSFKHQLLIGETK